MNMPWLGNRLKTAYAAAVLGLHRAKLRLGYWRLRHGLKLTVLALLMALILTTLGLPFLEGRFGSYFNSPESLGALRSLLGGMGSALIGAAAIAFSIIVFAMQTNVERMPHGLFKKLSSDLRLLSSFLGSFLTAIAVAGTSLIPDASWAITAILVATWGVVCIVLLFLYAYRRALQLINPIEQLNIMLKVVRLDLKKWSYLGDNAAILLRKSETPMTTLADADAAVRFNASKAAYYGANSQWSSSAVRAIHYAISYAKRFAEQGDYDVTTFAFVQMAQINAAYCEAKLGTFVGSNPFFETPGTSDSLINVSLEELRQTMHGALIGGDERLAESTLRAMAGLYMVYLTIEYPGLERTKHHALLASNYLSSAIESVIPHDMPDLMMQGLRMMGEASRVALSHTSPNEVVGIAQKIGTLSYVGVLKANHQPVTLVAIEQLSMTTFHLLVHGKHDIGYAVRQLRSAITDASKRFLTTPETPISATHRNTLSAYFSDISLTSLSGRLASLGNELLGAPAEHERAGEVISNIETWANQIFLPQKELLLLSVERRSSFAIDVIGWAVGISKLLNALSMAAGCPERVEDDLRRHAIWLISTLSWLPDDRESVSFVETISLTESLFEAALDGHQLGCSEFYNVCKKLLLEWAKKGGRHQTGWGTLESTIKALVALVIVEGTPEAVVTLKAQLAEMLGREGAPSEQMRQQAAERLTTHAYEMRNFRDFRQVDRVLAQQNPATVRELLLDMVEILTPEPEDFEANG